MAGWEEAPTCTEPRDALDLERMEVDANTSHDTGDASERVASVVGGLFIPLSGHSESNMVSAISTAIHGGAHMDYTSLWGNPHE